MSLNPFDSYEEYIKSDIWKLKRDTMIKDFKHCQICKKTKSLVVHHLNYFNLGNESRKDLLVVCWDCHNKIHQNKLKGGNKRYNFENTENKEQW